MTRTIVAAITIAAVACGLSAASASAQDQAQHHKKYHASAHASATPTQNPAAAEQIQGVNPMTNSPAIPPAANKQPYAPVPGVNPM